MKIPARLVALLAVAATALALAGAALANVPGGDSGNIYYGDSCSTDQQGWFALDPYGNWLECNGFYWTWRYDW